MKAKAVIDKVVDAAIQRDRHYLRTLARQYNLAVCDQSGKNAAFYLGELNDANAFNFLMKHSNDPFNVSDFNRGRAVSGTDLTIGAQNYHHYLGDHSDGFQPVSNVDDDGAPNNNLVHAAPQMSEADLIISHILGYAINENSKMLNQCNLWVEDAEGLTAAMHLGMLRIHKSCEYLIRHTSDPLKTRIHCAAGAIYGGDSFLAVELIKRVEPKEIEDYTPNNLFARNPKLASSFSWLLKIAQDIVCESKAVTPAVSAPILNAFQQSANDYYKCANNYNQSASDSTLVFNESLTDRLAKLYR